MISHIIRRASMVNRVQQRSAMGVMNTLRCFASFSNDVSNSPIRIDAAGIDKMHNNNRLKPRRVPIQLRQSGDSGDGGMEGKGSRMLIDTRLRKGPYWHLSNEQGCWCYSVYNKIYHPRAYVPIEEGGLMKEYKYLTEHVTMWNVAVERQIQITGRDADAFVDFVITRRASICPVNKCRYVILCNDEGGVLNDPILLHPAENEWWFSLADSDLVHFLQGVNIGKKFDVAINEIDVAPVQIQGPKAPALMHDLTKGATDSMKYYDMIHTEVGGCPVVVSCSGFSAELGFEIYLRDATKNAEKMWYAVLDAGKKHDLLVIAPGHHRRIEAGILSYGADFDIETNPYEVGLGWQVDLTKDDFCGKKALAKINEQGVTHKLKGIRMGGKPITWYNADFYHVFHDDELVGYVTSAWYSPTQGSNIAFAMLPVELSENGQKLRVALPKLYSTEPTVEAQVEKTPFRAPALGHKGTGLLQTGTKL